MVVKVDGLLGLLITLGIVVLLIYWYGGGKDKFLR